MSTSTAVNSKPKCRSSETLPAGPAPVRRADGPGRSFQDDQRRTQAAGSHHGFRATGITEYMRNGAKLEMAQQMANHEAARSAGTYDWRADQINLDEVESVLI